MDKSLNLEILDRNYWNADKMKEPNKHHTKKIHSIVVHHTAVNNKWNKNLKSRIKSHQNYHTNDRGWNDICYHYLITKEGQIIQGREVSYISSPHRELDKKFGESIPHDLDGVVSVCLLGNFEEEDIENGQKDAWVSLVKNLQKKYNILIDNIYMHQNCPSYDTKKFPTLCPGKHIKKYFDKDNLNSLLNPN
jgi:hypothetical protein